MTHHDATVCPWAAETVVRRDGRPEGGGTGEQHHYVGKLNLTFLISAVTLLLLASLENPANFF
jgi:hypothetical protein